MNSEFVIRQSALLLPGEMPDISNVPANLRRRLSPLQKVFFALAEQVKTIEPRAVVFASPSGESAWAHRLIEDFTECEAVSPHRFSTSVFNAAPGLWSIHTENTAPYTAVTAAEETISAGLLETLQGNLPALFVLATEVDGGYGTALVLDAPAPDEAAPLIHATVQPRTAEAPFDEWVAFLKGESNTWKGRFVTLERASK